MKRLNSSGIILRRLDYGEADRIITFLTSDYGKIRAIAKGVRKQKSKLAGGIELFSISEIHFIKGRGDIDTLVSTRLIKNFGNIVKDLNRTEAAYDMLKTLDRTLEDEGGGELFSLLEESLAALDDDLPVVLAELSFTMRLLQSQGHLPDFRLGSDGKQLSEEARYQFDFDKNLFAENPDGPFDKNHLKLLRLLAHNPPQNLRKVQGIGEYCNQLLPLGRALAGHSLPALTK